MRLLLTNDDGVDAAGLAALAEAARQVGEAVVVAPACAHSGCSHRVTADAPFRVTERERRLFVVEGTPADCVRVGLHSLAPETDWVLSGINHGGNLGADVHLSGTVAAVREGALLGRPGIAISHYRRRGMEFDWSRAARWIAPLLTELISRPWRRGTFWNVNLPHLDDDAADPPVRYCPVDPAPLPIHYERQGDFFRYAGIYQGREQTPGHDVEACFGGEIAVSLVTLGGPCA